VGGMEESVMESYLQSLKRAGYNLWH
jgi:hypothetical protein